MRYITNEILQSHRKTIPFLISDLDFIDSRICTYYKAVLTNGGIICHINKWLD